MQRLAQLTRNFPEQAAKQGVRAAAQVAGAHRGGERQPVHAAEGLHLQGTDEGDQRIDEEIEFAVRNKADREQTCEFEQNHGLMPGKPPGLRQLRMNDFRSENAEGIEQNRQQIPRPLPPLPVGQVEAEEHHVPGHGIGEYLSPVQISVDVEKAADHAQHAGGGQAFRIR